ncbi:hypothetical protein JKP88DRAFT_252025 [Tribonema minus]|uniref:Uncharacterized protein n=1 Tax=Tribonema minus TaxID=303371 RepID=A0A836CLG7_9STRA|nr:hypothetical protein JKP88DRAFT_252025 [Tribonema minus]
MLLRTFLSPYLGGHRLCEKCCALFFEGQLRDRTANPACPAGCQCSVGYALPQPSGELSEFLAKAFPQDWEQRMRKGEHCRSSDLWRRSRLVGNARDCSATPTFNKLAGRIKGFAYRRRCCGAVGVASAAVRKACSPTETAAFAMAHMERPWMKPGPTRFYTRLGAVLFFGFIAVRAALLSGWSPGGAAAAAAAAAIVVPQRTAVSYAPLPPYALPAMMCPRDKHSAIAARSITAAGDSSSGGSDGSGAAFSASTWTLYDYAAGREAVRVPIAAACPRNELSAADAQAAAAAGGSNGGGSGGGAWLFASDLTLLDYFGKLAPVGFTLYPPVHPRTAALYTLLDPLRASYGACTGAGNLHHFYAPLFGALPRALPRTLPRALPPFLRAAAAVLLINAVPLLGVLPLLHLDPNLPGIPIASGGAEAETWRHRGFWLGWLLGQRAMGMDVVFIALVRLVCLTIASWRCYARLLRGAAPQLHQLPFRARCMRALRTRANWYLEDVVWAFVFYPCLHAIFSYPLPLGDRLVIGPGTLWMQVIQVRLLACACALLLIAPPPLRRTRRYAAVRDRLAYRCSMHFGADFTDEQQVDKLAWINW